MGSIEQLNTTDSANRIEPGSYPLSIPNFPDLKTSECGNPLQVTTDFVNTFNEAAKITDINALVGLFQAQAYWRDQLCLSWDFHTVQGPDNIAAILKQSQAGLHIKSIQLDTSTVFRSPRASTIGTLHTVSAFLKVETDVGRGAGAVNLVQDHGVWKVYTLFTYLVELKGHEESAGPRRPTGYEGHDTSLNWLDQRTAELNFEDAEPAILILGAGQAGLSISARLRALGIKSLIVDRHARVGDNWRTRYHNLVLHDPVWFDHMPYVPYPETFPVHIPKDKMANWLESYVELMELNVWTSTSITESSWDESSGKWTVSLTRIRNGSQETRTIYPKHIIQATGHSGEPNLPTNIKGFDSFTGTRFEHSSKFVSAPPANGNPKKVIVVGACNSSHDIAKSFQEQGHSVTMVQRSSTYVLSVKNNDAAFAPLYGENSPPVEDSDMFLHGTPNAILKKLQVEGCEALQKADEEILGGLKKAGFKTDKGIDGSGIWMKYLQRGGGYYLDSGCSQLIADGKIKVKQGQEITEVLPSGLKFADGDVIEADEIVWATGWTTMRDSCRKIFGNEVADRVRDVWGMDEEGEIRTMWRKSGHPGFWFMAGNLALCRWFSRPLALQIKALEEGICKYEDL